MSNNMILETITFVADCTQYTIKDRVRLIENLLKLANNSEEPSK